MGMGKKMLNEPLKNRIRWSKLIKFDALYYSGVVAMVGFWLALGTTDGVVTVSLFSYATFALSYMTVIVFEPIFTYTILSIAKKYEDNVFVSRFTQINTLRVS